MKSDRPRLLIVKLSSLGDIFHALPAAHNLQKGFNARMDWVVQNEYVDLVRCFEGVERVIGFPRRGMLGGIGRFARTLRSVEYDLVVDLQGLLKSAIATGLARGRRKIGPSFNREGSRLFYHEIAGRRDIHRHAVEQCLDAVRHLGLPVYEPTFPVRFPAYPVAEPRPRVALLPVSRWLTKNWPLEHFAQVAQDLVAERNASVYLVGSAADAGACSQIEAAARGRAANLAGKLNLMELGGFLKEMDLLIANDSGPVHMAAAVGTPSLVVFGPTDHVRTGPFGRQHRVAVADLDCRPCYERQCPRSHLKCVRNVTPHQVLRSAFEMLDALK